MKIEPIEYENFKELEGKLNTLICMTVNEESKLSIEDLLDFCQEQKLPERKKIHLAISATMQAMISANTPKK